MQGGIQRPREPADVWRVASASLGYLRGQRGGTGAYARSLRRTEDSPNRCCLIMLCCGGPAMAMSSVNQTQIIPKNYFDVTLFFFPFPYLSQTGFNFLIQAWSLLVGVTHTQLAREGYRDYGHPD